jgi:hypothetical protein
MPCRQAKDAEIGLFADLIGVDSAFSARNQLITVETGQWAGFSANSLPGLAQADRSGDGVPRDYWFCCRRLAPLTNFISPAGHKDA